MGQANVASKFTNSPWSSACSCSAGLRRRARDLRDAGMWEYSANHKESKPRSSAESIPCNRVVGPSVVRERSRRISHLLENESLETTRDD